MDHKRKLYRLPEKGRVTGVIAGIADYFEMDVTLLRLLFVVSVFATDGFTVILYIILALVLPSFDGKTIDVKVTGESLSKNAANLSRELREKDNVIRVRNYFGIALILLGAWFLVAQFVPDLWEFRWDIVWPLVLIVVGAVVISRGKK